MVNKHRLDFLYEVLKGLGDMFSKYAPFTTLPSFAHFILRNTHNADESSDQANKKQKVEP